MTGGQWSLLITSMAVCLLVGWAAYLLGRHHKRRDEEGW